MRVAYDGRYLIKIEVTELDTTRRIEIRKGVEKSVIESELHSLLEAMLVSKNFKELIK